MSDDRSTKRPETGSYEPTQYAKNPYETTAAYDVPPIPPPPPSNNKRSWWYIAVPILMVVALVVLIGVPSIVFSKQPIPTPSSHFDPGATATAQTKATQSNGFGERNKLIVHQMQFFELRQITERFGKSSELIVIQTQFYQACEVANTLRQSGQGIISNIEIP